MSDEIHIVRGEEKKRRPWKRIAVAAALTLAVLAGIVFLSDAIVFDGLKRSLRYLGKTAGEYGHIDLDGAENAAFAAADGGLVLANETSLRLFDEDGSLTGSISHSAAQPALCSAAERVLCYDIGGTLCAVYDADGDECFRVTADGTLFDANLSENGYAAVLYAAADVRGVLEIYHPNGSLLYRYRSATDYLNVCAVAPDGSTAVSVRVGQENVRFRSTALLLATDREDAPTEVALGEQLIFDLCYLDGQTVCAVGESSVLMFTPEGERLGEYWFEDSAVAGWCFTEDGLLLALDTFRTAERYTLVLLGRTAEPLSETVTDAAPLSLSAAGNYIAVLTDARLTVYDTGLELYATAENGGKYTFAAVRADGTTLAAGSGEADLIFP